MNIEIELAGVRLRISLRLRETVKYFRPFITRSDCDGWDIRVEDEDIPRYPLICPSGVLDPFSEAYLLMPRASAFLLKHDRALIHGVSFVWRGRAWLLTAPSGTGKTTQLRHWQRLCGDELEIINGDKSVLALETDGSLRLHPSPWTGKELDAGTVSAPLAGVVVLRQADHNAISLLKPRESVFALFQQFLNLCDDAEEAHAIEGLETRLIESVPVWRLDNLGDEDSARLTIQTLSEYEATNHESI